MRLSVHHKHIGETVKLASFFLTGRSSASHRNLKLMFGILRQVGGGVRSLCSVIRPKSGIMAAGVEYYIAKVPKDKGLFVTVSFETKSAAEAAIKKHDSIRLYDTDAKKQVLELKASSEVIQALAEEEGVRNISLTTVAYPHSESDVDGEELLENRRSIVF